ncbi:CAP domain, partial [Dillenia turbinata]
MNLSKITIAFLCLVGLVLVPSSHAQYSPQDYLNARNTAQAQVGVGPIAWNDTIAANAQNYANQKIGDCNLVQSGGPYGENLAEGIRSFSGTDAVNLWVAEKPYYDHNSNSCVAGQCLHYTQVVWHNSVHLGCARVECNNASIIFLISSQFYAQNSPDDYVREHNNARSNVSVPCLQWNDTLAEYAQSYANNRTGDCILRHSNTDYGENLFIGTGRNYTGVDAVDAWVPEEQNYDYSTNTCAQGAVCGHYTQVVWNTTTSIGCARVTCNNGSIFITCNYYPAGNIPGW